MRKRTAGREDPAERIGRDDPEVIRILAGSARSGTTWLLDALADANGLRTFFEPLHPGAMPEAAPFAYHYVAPEVEWPELELFLRELLSGRGTRAWPDLRVRLDRFFQAARLGQVPGVVVGRTLRMAEGWWQLRRLRGRPILCKLIRANLMLGWLARRLPARTLLLVRHPAGVVASQLRTDPLSWHRPEDQLRLHLADASLVEAHLQPLLPFLSGPLEPVELRTALWCIENAIPMAQAEAWGLTLVSYERLLQREEAEWRRAADAFGLTGLPDEGRLARPSTVASRDFKQRRAAAPRVGRWIDQLSSDQKARIGDVLERFGVTRYSTGDPLPLS